MTTEISDSTTTQDNWGAVIQNDSTNTQNTQVQAEVVPKEQYLNAQAFGTKARQNEIAMATKLAQKDSAELHAISDSVVKDAVTRQLLWMSYAEASAVLGANFDITASNDDKSGNNADNNSDIVRKLKLLEYKDSQREKDSALAAFQAANPELFKWDAEAMKAKIEKELEYVSASLPIEERISRAATASLGNPMDKQSLAYNLLLNWTAWNPRGVANPQEEAKTKTENLQSELRAMWWLPAKK